ncbi:DUF7833 domain-containing protein [Pedobacter panaciterrae]
MNYIDLLNHFWKLNKDFSFTPNEKAVYFALLFKWNELRRKDEFNQSNEYLAADAGISDRSVQRARKILSDAGLIRYRSGDGRNKSTVYAILDITKGSHKVTLLNNKDSHSDNLLNNKGRQDTGTSVTLSIENPIKKGDTDADNISILDIEGIANRIEREEEEKSSQKNPIPFGISSVYSSMEDVEFICLNQSQVWHESMMKKFEIKDQKEMKKWISEFFELQRAAGQDKRDLNDSRRHCFSWINLQIKNQKEKSSAQKEKVIQNAPTSNKGVDAAMEWAGVERRKNV